MAITNCSLPNSIKLMAGTADGDMSSNLGLAAKRTGATTYGLAANGDEAVGIFTKVATTGLAVEVCIGEVLAYFGAAHATVPGKFADITVNASGQIITAIASSCPCGRALDVAAGSDYQPILFSKNSTQTAHIALSAAAEAGDAIVVTMTSSHPAATTEYECKLVDASGLLEVAGAFTITIGGSGTAIVGDVKPRILFKTHTDGTCTLTVADVATGSALVTQMIVRPINAIGPAARLALTFTT